jgi:hypothetical protein
MNTVAILLRIQKRTKQMKKLAIAAALIGSAMTAQAASNWDGLYNCNIYISNQLVGSSYISINSNPTGTRAMYTVSALQSNPVVFGGGYGNITNPPVPKGNTTLQTTNNTFTGNTFIDSKFELTKYTFNLTIEKSNVIRGNVTIASAANPNFSVNATVACTRVNL